MKVYIIKETECKDYHGCYDKVLDIVSDINKAKAQVFKLEGLNNKYDISYSYEKWEVK